MTTAFSKLVGKVITNWQLRKKSDLYVMRCPRGVSLCCKCVLLQSGGECFKFRRRPFVWTPEGVLIRSFRESWGCSSPPLPAAAAIIRGGCEQRPCFTCRWGRIRLECWGGGLCIYWERRIGCILCCGPTAKGSGLAVVLIFFLLVFCRHLRHSEALLKEVDQGLAQVLPCPLAVQEVTLVWVNL